MRRSKHIPHTLDEDEMLDHLREENWMTYASASHEPKRLEVRVGGAGFRVTVRDVEVYKGLNVSDAVRAYNEAS